MDENTKIKQKFPKIGDLIVYLGYFFWYKAILLKNDELFFIDHCNKSYKGTCRKVSLYPDYFLNNNIKIF